MKFFKSVRDIAILGHKLQQFSGLKDSPIDYPHDVAHYLSGYSRSETDELKQGGWDHAIQYYGVPDVFSQNKYFTEGYQKGQQFISENPELARLMFLAFSLKHNLDINMPV